MTANVDAMIRTARESIKAGKKAEARALLEKAVELDQYNEQAWLWLSAVVESIDDQRVCLENVLALNPDNERAKQGLAQLGGSSAAAPPPPAPSSTPAFTTDSDFDDMIESSVQWGAPEAPAEPAPPARRRPETSAAEYDDWIAGLNLSKSESEKADSGIQVFGPGEDHFSNLFGEDSGLMKPVDVPASSQSDLRGAFSDDISFGDDFDNEPDNRAASSAAFSKGPFAGSFDVPPTPEAPARTSAKPSSNLMSPVTEHTGKKGTGNFQFASNDELPADSLFMSDYGPSSGSSEEMDPTEFFNMIPKSIKPARLPGTREGSPVLMMAGVAVLGLLNVFALIFLISRMAG